MLSSWLISILTHVAIFCLMFVTPWLGAMAGNEQELPLASAELAGKPGPSLSTSSYSSTGLTAPPSLMGGGPSLESVRVEPSGMRSSVEPSASPKGGMNIIGIGSGGGSDLSGLRIGGGGAGPEFFGLKGGGGGGSGDGEGGGRAVRKIVYVVDRSGSMITTFNIVREELIRSISDLRRTHQFHVIFFSSDEPVENPPKRLVSASETQKKEAFAFLETIHPEGGTDPTSALKRALEVRPDIIYLLTDGVIPDAPRLLEALKIWNKDGRVRIHTIAFLSREGQELLERISREHQGDFRYLSEDEFYRHPRTSKTP